MAPDSRSLRHQLGKATTAFRHLPLLHVTISFIFLLTFCTTTIEAKTERIRDSWSELSASFMIHERPSHKETMILSSLPPTSRFLNAFPGGRWNNRIHIPIPSHPTIERYIQFYEGKGRKTLLEALERSWTFLPLMAEILNSHGVPPELVYVALVESCFKRRASYRGAGGYWQILASTARAQGLRVDRWVDERMDPIKSTQAAARYLRSSYEQFGSWPLALAAYNVGEGPVISALKRSGRSDFWDLMERGNTPGRTRAYVPKVLAAIQAMRDLESRGVERPKHLPIYDFESIVVESPLRLEQVAKWLGMPIDEIRELNPSLLKDQIPPGSGFVLRLPSGARDKFDVAYRNYVQK